MALLRLRGGGRRLLVHHEDRGLQLPRSRALSGRPRPHRHRGGYAGRRRVALGEEPYEGDLRAHGRVLSHPAHARARRGAGRRAEVPGLPRLRRRGAEEVDARLRPRARGARPASFGLGLQTRRDDPRQRGPRRARGPGARPLLRARDVPHLRRPGRLCGLRRPRHRRRRAEVPELPGNAAVPQVPGALRARPGEGAHGLYRLRHRSGRLHRRHCAARGGRHQRGGHPGHGAHHAAHPGARQARAQEDRLPVRRRRGGSEGGRPRPGLHRREHLRQEPQLRGASGRHPAEQPGSGRVRAGGGRAGFGGGGGRGAPAHRVRPRTAPRQLRLGYRPRPRSRAGRVPGGARPHQGHASGEGLRRAHLVAPAGPRAPRHRGGRRAGAAGGPGGAPRRLR